MRSPTRQRRSAVAFNMTPLIDISFLLIVFFIVSSHLAQQEVRLELDLPDAESGANATTDAERRLVINLLPDGSIMTAGRTVSLGQLEELIREERRIAGPDVEVRIRGDRLAPYGQAAPILVACTKAGVWQVTFAVRPRD
ncbi:MAG: ExbD/TolR family protein [Pirellulales bacterium]